MADTDASAGIGVSRDLRWTAGRHQHRSQILAQESCAWLLRSRVDRDLSRAAQRRRPISSTVLESSVTGRNALRDLARYVRHSPEADCSLASKGSPLRRWPQPTRAQPGAGHMGRVEVTSFPRYCNPAQGLAQPSMFPAGVALEDHVKCGRSTSALSGGDASTTTWSTRSSASDELHPPSRGSSEPWPLTSSTRPSETTPTIRSRTRTLAAQGY